MAKPETSVNVSGPAVTAETPSNHLDEAERLCNMAIAQDSTAPELSHSLLMRSVQNLIQFIRKNV